MTRRRHRCARCVASHTSAGHGAFGWTSCRERRLCDEVDLSLVELRPDLSLEEHRQLAELPSLNEFDAMLSAYNLMPAAQQDEDGFVRLIREVHRELFSGVPLDAVGEFRADPVHLDVRPEDVFQGVEPRLIEPELRSLWGRIHRFRPPSNRDAFATWGAIFLQRFFAIHPFSDGNGRTARLLLAVAALRVDLFIGAWPTSGKGRREYLRALRRAHASCGLTSRGRDERIERDGFTPLRHWLWKLISYIEPEEAEPPLGHGDPLGRRRP